MEQTIKEEVIKSLTAQHGIHPEDARNAVESLEGRDLVRTLHRAGTTIYEIAEVIAEDAPEHARK